MRPQYFKNGLEPVDIDKQSLSNALAELRAAVRRAVDLIKSKCPSPDPNDHEAFGTIYNGSLGIAQMFLRLEHQASYLIEEDQSRSVPDFRRLANAYTSPHVSRFGRLSPLGSASLGCSITRVLNGCSSFGSNSTHAHCLVYKHDTIMLREAIRSALHQGTTLGSDEALYGRVGLLWAILNFRQYSVDVEEVQGELESLLEAVPRLLDLIMDTGRWGAHEYARQNGTLDALPLMWPWHDRYYIGAIHGIAGILTILLACESEELEDEEISKNHLPLIANTINKLCELCISHNGHLPSSFPPRTSSRPSPLVQICHGTPGLLLLLAQARHNSRIVASYWSSEWDEAIRLGSERVWEEGLLSKGGGICHGIAGNAWPLLMLHSCYIEYDTDRVSPLEDGSGPPWSRLSADHFLSRALALLLHARETQPFNTTATQQQYRMPDNPYSLFEGLSGTVCAWAEACVAISKRLRSVEEVERREMPSNRDSQNGYELGMPGLGGAGQPRGLL